MIEFFASHMPSASHWLMLSSLLFAIGIYGVLSRRNAIAVLMSVELMLNSAAMNLIIFNKFLNPAALDGQVMALFVIAIAAAEAVVAMAIFVAIYRCRATINVDRMNAMKN